MFGKFTKRELFAFGLGAFVLGFLEVIVGVFG